MDITTALGVVAGVLTTTSFLPQVIKTWKTRHTKDISAHMFTLLLAGIVLWLVYGLIKSDIPVVFANGVSLVFVAIILYFKVKYG